MSLGSEQQGGGEREQLGREADGPAVVSSGSGPQSPDQPGARPRAEAKAPDRAGPAAVQGCGVSDRGSIRDPAATARRQPLPPAMLPVPGSRWSASGLSALFTAAPHIGDSHNSSLTRRSGPVRPDSPQLRTLRAAPSSAAPAPGSETAPVSRSRLPLWLPLIALGSLRVALTSAAESLGTAPQVKSVDTFYFGTMVIGTGIISLATRKKPTVALANMLVFLSTSCVLLGLFGLVLESQDAQFVASITKCDLVNPNETTVCLCCEELHNKTCTEESSLKLFNLGSCRTTQLTFQKILFANFVLSILIVIVCLAVAVLNCIQRFLHRRSSSEECWTEDQTW